MTGENRKTASFVLTQPGSTRMSLDLGSLWEYRELLYFLTWRDVKVRYKQTILGASWVIFQPLIMMAIYTIFFGQLGKISGGGVAYPLFIFSGLLPWQLFANGVADCGTSLVANRNLITKVYFPRVVIPMAAVLARLVDFFCGFSVLLGMLFYFGINPDSKLWTLPFFVLLTIMTSLGVGLWFSALNVKYRDVHCLVPFFVQVWFFLCPIVYPSSMVPAAWKTLYGLNPMVAVVEGFRWSLLGKGETSELTIAISATMVLAVLFCGLYFFRHVERTFADIV
jgi:lipopolysaccharide transport system permease protein